MLNPGMQVKCTICDTPIQRDFCPTCGQKANKRETTSLDFVKEVFTNLFSLERSAFATAYQFLKQPGRIVSNYFNGFRKYYASPGKILLYCLTIMALHVGFVNERILGGSISNGLSSHISFGLVFFPLITVSALVPFLLQKQKVARLLISVAYASAILLVIWQVIADFAFLFLPFERIAMVFLLSYVISVFVYQAVIFTKRGGLKYRLLNILYQLLVFVFLFILGAVFQGGF